MRPLGTIGHWNDRQFIAIKAKEDLGCDGCDIATEQLVCCSFVHAEHIYPWDEQCSHSMACDGILWKAHNDEARAWLVTRKLRG
jgi:hypothetical protein